MDMRPTILAAAGFLCTACLLCSVLPAHAHKAMAFAYIQGGRVHVEGYFADGKRLGDSLVEVFDARGAKLLQGKTDAGGVFSFPEPEERGIRIVLTGSMGHRAECAVEGCGQEGREGGRSASESTEARLSAAKTDAATQEDVRAVVSQELDKRLAPLLREIRTLKQERPSVTEILGGIGYIVGIMGVIMYFKARPPRGS